MSPRLRFWLLLAALVLFSRLFQSGVLWPEEGLPLAAAREMLAGRTLYRDIWFDKPPLLACFYAGALRLAGTSLYALRLLGVLYILAVAATGYALARRQWNEPTARWTAFFLAFFTGFYVHSATVPLAADLLLLLPHLGVFYCLAADRPWAAGLIAGAAFHLNPKALLVLAAAGVWGGARALLPLGGGFLLAATAGLAVLGATGAWQQYLEQVWRWGAAYAQAPFTDRPWALGIERTLNWIAFHAALMIGAALWFWQRPRERWQAAAWLLASFVGVITGARFFPRYYFLLLAPLAVVAGAGWASLRRSKLAVAALVAVLAVPAIRFGRVNLWLALGRSFEWRDAAIDADSRHAAAHVRRLSAATDSIFVWGFRPEIYFYAQRPAATRYLESQPLTGVLADRHLERSDPFLPERAAHHRQEAARQLQQRPPAAIVDGLGPYNPRLAMENYAELRPLLDRYRLAARTPGARIYTLMPPISPGR